MLRVTNNQQAWFLVGTVRASSILEGSGIRENTRREQRTRFTRSYKRESRREIQFSYTLVTTAVIYQFSSMALGPVAKVVAQAVLMGVSILARAIPAAYGAALQNAKKGGVDAAKATSEGILSRKKMSIDEALMVMNLEKSQVTPESVQKVRKANKIYSYLAFNRSHVSLNINFISTLLLFLMTAIR